MQNCKNIFQLNNKKCMQSICGRGGRGAGIILTVLIISTQGCKLYSIRWGLYIKSIVNTKGKGIVTVISSNPRCKNGNLGFTTVPLNISDNFSIVSCKQEIPKTHLKMKKKLWKNLKPWTLSDSNLIDQKKNILEHRRKSKI